MKKINRNNITEHLIEYQLNLINKTIEDAKKIENWWEYYTLTTDQYIIFKKYAIPLLKKIFKFNKEKAEKTFSWFDLSYGLKIKD